MKTALFLVTLLSASSALALSSTEIIQKLNESDSALNAKKGIFGQICVSTGENKGCHSKKWWNEYFANKNTKDVIAAKVNNALSDVNSDQEWPQDITFTSDKIEPKKLDVSTFKETWCKNINQSFSSVFEVKGIQSGDICLLNDSVIDSILKKVSKNEKVLGVLTDSENTEYDYYFYTHEFSHFFANPDITFLKVNLLIDNLGKSVFIWKADIQICKSDKKNTLNDDSPMRTALESRYGSKPLRFTERSTKEFEYLKAEPTIQKMLKGKQQTSVSVKDWKETQEFEYLLANKQAYFDSLDDERVEGLLFSYDGKSSLKGLIAGTPGLFVFGDDMADSKCGENGGYVFKIQPSEVFLKYFKTTAEKADLLIEKKNQAKSVPDF
jgi:hypothetical protein